jgi:hypothetical protein
MTGVKCQFLTLCEIKNLQFGDLYLINNNTFLNNWHLLLMLQKFQSLTLKNKEQLWKKSLKTQKQSATFFELLKNKTFFMIERS